MTTMTRMITVLLTLALCAALFTGCGGSSVDLKNAKSLADLNGAKIAAQSGTFHETALSQIENVQASTYPEFSSPRSRAARLTAILRKSRQLYLSAAQTAL